MPSRFTQQSTALPHASLVVTNITEDWLWSWLNMLSMKGQARIAERGGESVLMRKCSVKVPEFPKIWLGKRLKRL